MLQVDENIGGRQDQKYNGLRTKTLAVGLLMMVGCFVVGYFSATTTTTTAHTRGVSSPNGNSFHIYKPIPSEEFYSIHYPAISRSLNSCIFFFTKHNLTLIRSGKVNGMVSNLQHYPYVHITNNTPYATPASAPRKWPFYDDDDDPAGPTYVLHAVHVVYNGGYCADDYVYEAIAPGGSWTASSRGLCLVHFVSAILALPGFPDGFECGQYKSSGTSYSQYSIIMDGDCHDVCACSVVRIWTGKPSLYLGDYFRKKIHTTRTDDNENCDFERTEKITHTQIKY